MTMEQSESGTGELEGWRLLNQQKPLEGWFSDASTTSATESFPSYLFLSLPLPISLSTLPSSRLLSVGRSLTRPLLRYTLRFVLTDDYDTDKGKDSLSERKTSRDSQNQKYRGAFNELLQI